MSQKAKRIPVALDQETYDQLKSYAAKQGKSMSDVASSYISDGLRGTVAADQIDLISRILREQLSSLMKDQTDRIAAQSYRAALNARAAVLLNAQVLDEIISDDDRDDFDELYNMAFKKAAQDLRIQKDD